MLDNDVIDKKTPEVTVVDYRALIRVLKSLNKDDFTRLAAGANDASVNMVCEKYKKEHPSDTRTDKKIYDWMRNERRRLRGARSPSLPITIARSGDLELIAEWNTLTEEISAMYRDYQAAKAALLQLDHMDQKVTPEAKNHEQKFEMTQQKTTEDSEMGGKIKFPEYNKAKQISDVKNSTEGRQEEFDRAIRQHFNEGLVQVNEIRSEAISCEKGMVAESVTVVENLYSGSPLPPFPDPNPRDSLESHRIDEKKFSSFAMSCGFQAEYPPADKVVEEINVDFGAAHLAANDDFDKTLAVEDRPALINDVPNKVTNHHEEKPPRCDAVAEVYEEFTGETKRTEKMGCTGDAVADETRLPEVAANGCSGVPATPFPDPSISSKSQIDIKKPFCSTSMPCSFDAEYPPAEGFVYENEHEKTLPGDEKEGSLVSMKEIAREIANNQDTESAKKSLNTLLIDMVLQSTVMNAPLSASAGEISEETADETRVAEKPHCNCEGELAELRKINRNLASDSQELREHVEDLEKRLSSLETVIVKVIAKMG